MRPDMKKLLCERPRPHDSWYSPVRNKSSARLEDLPFTQSMSRGKYGTKVFGEYLAPLKRFINKQVGRKWNDVFSEICDQINGTNPVETHVLEHIDGYISIKVERVSTAQSSTGLVHVGGVSKYQRRHNLRQGDLYVDPDDGVVKVAKDLVKRPTTKREPDYRISSDNKTVFYKIEGLWYAFDVKYYMIDRQWVWFREEYSDDADIAIGDTKFGRWRSTYIIDGKMLSALPFTVDPFGWRDRKRFKNNNMILVNKRQLTSRELRQNNLKNTA